MKASQQIEVTPSFCYECYNNCPVRARVEDGVIVRVEGNPDAPHTEGRLCPKGVAALIRVYDPNRVKKPLRRTNPEKGIGVDPRWKEITWDEALDIVTQKLKELRDTNPKGLKMPSMELPRHAMALCLGMAFGTTSVGWYAGTGGGVQCGNAAHTLGTYLWNSFHDWPEYKYTKYALFIGTNTGFESDRAIPVDAKKIADARVRGMKLVVLDPRFTRAAAKADEWIPIRPGTDAAFCLGLINLLLNEYGIFDASYLRRHTNAPYLIGPDGHYVRTTDFRKPVIWDTEDNRAKPFDFFNGEDSSLRAALEGHYEVNGVPCQPAFQLLKERVKEQTPERVEEITTVPAATIRRVAREFGENAQIGSFIEIEGQRWPLRGSIVVFYRGTQGHVHSTLTTQAIYALEMVVGALGPPGGTGRLSMGRSLGDSPLAATADGTVDYNLHLHIPYSPPTWPSTEYDLGNYFPFNAAGTSHLHTLVGSDPTAWGLNPRMVILADNTNPVMSVGDQEKQVAYHRNAFVIMVEQYLTETAELADLVLPSNFQLERYNMTRVHAGHEYMGIIYARPAIQPLHEARDWWDVALEVWDRLDLLRGEGGFNYWINAGFGLKSEYALDLKNRYTLAEILERVAKNLIGEEGWKELAKTGVYFRKLPAAEKYMLFQPGRLAFYNEDMKKVGEELVAGLKKSEAYERLAQELDFSDYDALPTWKPGPLHQSDGKYDLYAVNGKSVFFTFTRSAFNPWLMEVAERDPYVLKVWINRDTAVKKGIRDGQQIWVESTAGKVQGEAKVTEGIHPECVGIAGTLGHWCDHPIAKGKGTHFNALISVSLKNTDTVCGNIQGSGVRVRVYPAK